MRWPRARRLISCINGSARFPDKRGVGYQTLTARTLQPLAMLASIFKDSKSALAFAASVIVCAIMLIGPKESGGVLDKAVTTYKDEGSSNAPGNGANMNAPTETPLIGDYQPEVSGLEEAVAGAPVDPAAPTAPSKVLRIDPVTGRPIGEMAPPPPPRPDASQPGAVGSPSVATF